MPLFPTTGTDLTGRPASHRPLPLFPVSEDEDRLSLSLFSLYLNDRWGLVENGSRKLAL
jgi:hypothetical protein